MSTGERTRDAPAADPDTSLDFDWIVIGSGFGGSVAALRLSEKGYRVAVLERGRDYADDQLPRSDTDTERYAWNPRKGRYGIMRPALFSHVVSAGQTGVGGGSLMYGGVLFRAQPGFYDDRQWKQIGSWEDTLAPHYATAERMLGVSTAPWESTNMALTKSVAEHFGAPDSFALTPTGVFFGEPGKTVPDPYFGGEGPDRTGCRRCGECMVGCRTGAANRLTKNYLWFARKHATRIIAEQEVIDVRPLGAADGSGGYVVTTEERSPGRNHVRSAFTARGVVFAGGAIGTNELLADCKARGSLERISDRLGHLVRTNSEEVLAVLFPEDIETWRDVTASSRVILDQDAQIEFLTTGPHADGQHKLFTLLTGSGRPPKRWMKLTLTALRHPRRLLALRTREGWSRRSLQMLVMQPRDNALRFRAKRKRGSERFRLVSERDAARPAPTHIEIGHRVAAWVAEQHGGIAQSTIFGAFMDIPQTAHILGGAVMGADAANGVVDDRLRVYGYHNMIVCDAAALPANPGVNPALTITALAEYAMSHVPPAVPALVAAAQSEPDGEPGARAQNLLPPVTITKQAS